MSRSDGVKTMLLSQTSTLASRTVRSHEYRSFVYMLPELPIVARAVHSASGHFSFFLSAKIDFVWVEFFLLRRVNVDSRQARVLYRGGNVQF